MYSPKVIEERLALASKSRGWDIKLHSIAEVEAYIEALDKHIDKNTGAFLGQLSDSDRRFILNEISACQCSFPYWATRYAHIRTHDDRIVRFDPNIAQNIVIDIWADIEEQGLAILLQQLKARQLGVSTLTELAIAHRVQFWPNVNAVVASSDPKKSEKMFKMMEMCWDMQPWWLMPKRTTDNVAVTEFGGHKSAVSIQSGSQFSGIARGATPSVFHLSELPDFVNPEDNVDAALLKAVHENPYTFGVLESTAAGMGNWWHWTWQISKEGWPKRKSRLRPVFLPWFIAYQKKDSDIWPTATWLKAHPVPENHQFDEVTLKHADRAKAYTKTNDLLRKYLGNDWEMPIEQMWFYEVDRQEHVRKKQLPHFLQEMPADDEEAFQTTNISAFDFDTIEFHETHAKNEPIGVYGLIGSQDDIPLKYQPSHREIDHHKPSIKISARWNPVQPKLDYELVPLKWQGYSEDDGLNKIYIWELPKPDHKYGMGVDLGEGLLQDRSCIEIIRQGNLDSNDCQVAEFASAELNSLDLWPFAMAIGTLYSPPIFKQSHQCKAVIECRWNGENCQAELRKRGWYHLHHWLRRDNLKKQKPHKIGWFTNAWSRPQMMDYLTKGLRDGWIEINSPWFVHEMKTLEKEEGAQDLRAAYGEHDDRIMSFGMCFFSLHENELKGGEFELANRRKTKNKYSDEPILYIPNISERIPTIDEEIDVLSLLGNQSPLAELVTEDFDYV